MMKAILVNDDRSLRWDNVPDPVIKPEEVFPKIESGEVNPTIYKTLPITHAEAAHDILYKGQNVGKVVLTVR